MRGKEQRDVTSAVSARSVSHTTGVDRVRALQRVLYRCAEQDRDRRFHAVYDKVARSDVLWRAWGEVRANRGAPGVDGITIDDVVRAGVGDFLDELAGKVRAGSYRPRPLRRVYIPKPGKPGQTRPLGIPTVVDRVVMAAAKIVLEPIFEADFLPSSYGFRPGLSAHHALETVRQTVTWRGKQWVLDADIRSCFDEIDHDALLVQVERRVCDRRMLKLLRGWLRAGVFEGGIVSAIEAGTPQGSPISPLLANIALHVLDEAWQGGGQRLGMLVRYADDLVVLCATRERAEQARELVAAVLDVLGLRLHPEKTRIAHLAERCRGVRLPRLPSPDAGVVEAAGSLVSAEVAVHAGDGPDQGQDPRADGPSTREAAAGVGGRERQPRGPWLGELLPLRKLRGQVRPDRQLRQRTPRNPRQRQARTPGRTGSAA